MFIIRNDKYQYLLYETKGIPVWTAESGREGMLMNHKDFAKRYPTWMQAYWAMRYIGDFDLIIEED